MTEQIYFATISLHHVAGGLEKNIVRVANYFAGTGRKVHLITFDEPDAVSFFDLDPRITWHKTGRTRPHTKISFLERLRVIGRIRAAISARDAGLMIVFHHGILFRFLVAAFGRPVRFVCSERNSLSIYNHVRTRKWNLNFILLSLTWRITVQMAAYIQDYPKFLRSKIIVLPNAVDPAKSYAAPDTPNQNGHFIVLAVGRLCAQKNYPLLISAFSMIHEKFPAWRMVIIGEGGIKNDLERQIAAQGLSDKVTIRPNTKDVASFYTSAHIFCMPSKWEGFPNALAEAMAHGLPCVGYQGCAGVNGLIQHEKTGVLADKMEDTKSLGHALEVLIRDPDARARYGRAGIEAMGPYDPGVIMAQWEQLARAAF